MVDPVTEPAKLTNADMRLDDHAFLMLSGTFQYQSGWMQGLGHIVDAEYIKRFLRAFDQEFLQKCNGKVVMVTHTHTNILKIEPMNFDKGEPFDIEQWGKELEKKVK